MPIKPSVIRLPGASEPSAPNAVEGIIEGKTANAAEVDTAAFFINLRRVNPLFTVIIIFLYE